MSRFHRALLAASLALFSLPAFAADDANRVTIANDVAEEINKAFGRKDGDKGRLSGRKVTVEVGEPTNSSFSHSFRFSTQIDRVDVSGTGNVKNGRQGYISTMKLESPMKRNRPMMQKRR